MTYYFVFIWGDVEPEVLEGPYDSYDDVEAVARKRYQEEGPENGYFYARIDWEKRAIEMESFPSGFEEEE
jgi:hypothetical protein